MHEKRSAHVVAVEDHGVWRGHRSWTVRVDGERGPAQVSVRDAETRAEAEAQAIETYDATPVRSQEDRDALARSNDTLGRWAGDGR